MFCSRGLGFLVGVRYNFVRVYPLFEGKTNKTIKIYGLEIFRPE